MRQLNLVLIRTLDYSLPFKQVIAAFVREATSHDLHFNFLLCDLVTDSCTRMYMLDRTVISHAARAHMTCESTCELNGVPKRWRAPCKPQRALT